MQSDNVIIYEVNVQVDREISEEFAGWLPGHMLEVVKSGGFLDATWWECDETEESERRHWSIHYRVSSLSRLENYVREQAPRLREEARRRFGERFQANRRILRLRERRDSTDS